MVPSQGQGGQKYSKCIKMSTSTLLCSCCSYALKWNAGKVYCSKVQFLCHLNYAVRCSFYAILCSKVQFLCHLNYIVVRIDIATSFLQVAENYLARGNMMNTGIL